MSSLQVSLLLLAAVAIAIVAGYNAWLFRGRRPRAPLASVLREGAGPAAPQPGGRVEPSLGLEPLAGEPGEGAGMGAGAARASTGPVLDARTDCIVELALPSPIAGERLLALSRGFRRAGGKPVAVEVARTPVPEAAGGSADRAGGAWADEPKGSPVPPWMERPAGSPRFADSADAGIGPGSGSGSGSGSADSAIPAQARPGGAADASRAAPQPRWQAPATGGQFDLVRIGVLLANRNGPLNAMEFSEFVAGVHALADQLSVLADTPDMSAVLARARELDEVCAGLDAQLSIAVETAEPLGLADLARLAAETGCQERGNNRYARLGPQGEVLFSLALADAPNRLSLLLDVPRAPASESPWDEMVACARLCAERLRGRLTDEGGRPLSDAELAGIAEQIRTRQERLEAIGIDAGSPLALRLFN